MAHSVRRHLRVETEEYDAAIRRFIPGYDEMLSEAAAAVATVAPARVIDLGAGTGALSADEKRAWQHFEEWSAEDTYLPLEEELAALVRLGFEARCIWQDGPMGVVVARRPPHG